MELLMLNKRMCLHFICNHSNFMTFFLSFRLIPKKLMSSYTGLLDCVILWKATQATVLYFRHAINVQLLYYRQIIFLKMLHYHVSINIS